MAPYTELLDGMTREQKMIVITYITESMEEPKPDIVDERTVATIEKHL